MKNLLFILFISPAICISQVDISFGFSRAKGDTIEVDIFMDTQEDVRQFNFEIRGLGGEVKLVGLVDGTAAANLFNTNFDDATHKISAFNLAGMSVPAGSSVILSVQFLNPEGITDICIQNAVAQSYTVTVGNCLDISSLTDVVDDSPEAKVFSIYPNPVLSERIISIVSPQRITGETFLYNQQGKLIKQQTLSSTNNQIDIQLLPKGIYLLSIISGEQSFSKRIIVQ